MSSQRPIESKLLCDHVSRFAFTLGQIFECTLFVPASLRCELELPSRNLKPLTGCPAEDAWVIVLTCGGTDGMILLNKYIGVSSFLNSLLVAASLPVLVKSLVFFLGLRHLYHFKFGDGLFFL